MVNNVTLPGINTPPERLPISKEDIQNILNIFGALIPPERQRYLSRLSHTLGSGYPKWALSDAQSAGLSLENSPQLVLNWRMLEAQLMEKQKFLLKEIEVKTTTYYELLVAFDKIREKDYKHLLKRISTDTSIWFQNLNPVNNMMAIILWVKIPKVNKEILSFFYTHLPLILTSPYFFLSAEEKTKEQLIKKIFLTPELKNELRNTESYIWKYLLKYFWNINEVQIELKKRKKPIIELIAWTKWAVKAVTPPPYLQDETPEIIIPDRSDIDIIFKLYGIQWIDTFYKFLEALRKHNIWQGIQTGEAINWYILNNIWEPIDRDNNTLDIFWICYKNWDILPWTSKKRIRKAIKDEKLKSLEEKTFAVLIMLKDKNVFEPRIFTKYSFLLLTYPQILTSLDAVSQNIFFKLFITHNSGNKDIKNIESPFWKYLLKYFPKVEYIQNLHAELCAELPKAEKTIVERNWNNLTISYPKLIWSGKKIVIAIYLATKKWKKNWTPTFYSALEWIPIKYDIFSDVIIKVAIVDIWKNIDIQNIWSENFHDLGTFKQIKPPTQAPTQAPEIIAVFVPPTSQEPIPKIYTDLPPLEILLEAEQWNSAKDDEKIQEAIVALWTFWEEYDEALHFLAVCKKEEISFEYKNQRIPYWQKPRGERVIEKILSDMKKKWFTIEFQKWELWIIHALSIENTNSWSSAQFNISWVDMRSILIIQSSTESRVEIEILRFALKNILAYLLTLSYENTQLRAWKSHIIQRLIERKQMLWDVQKRLDDWTATLIQDSKEVDTWMVWWNHPQIQDLPILWRRWFIRIGWKIENKERDIHFEIIMKNIWDWEKNDYFLEYFYQRLIGTILMNNSSTPIYNDEALGILEANNEYLVVTNEKVEKRKICEFFLNAFFDAKIPMQLIPMSVFSYREVKKRIYSTSFL